MLPGLNWPFVITYQSVLLYQAGVQGVCVLKHKI